MKLNINRECKVKLLPRGVDAIKEHYKGLQMPEPDFKVGDTYTGPLWEVMNIFGSKTNMGPMPAFETEIEFTGI